MSTCTMSYTIKHGSTSLGTFSRQTQVDIKHGSNNLSSLTTTATTTLATGGKYCPSNITVGDKTLATAGTYVPYNIVVNTTATTYYYWNRYAISKAYTTSKVTGNVTLFNRTRQVNYIEKGIVVTSSGAPKGIYLGTGYTANASGFSLTGASCPAGDYNWGTTKYVVVPTGATGYWSNNAIYHQNDWTYGSGYYLMQIPLARMSTGTPSSSYVTSLRPNNTKVNCNYYTSSGYNVRGAYQTQVSSTSTSAYPSNGISGSYWYTYVG